ncbi:hypothetical protein Pla108_30650 [Botrimarina colliarenosi]|uniref:Ice-binding protein C-terminal domain-containing protein n=1 Tax=Botrimarina colliarenosi TaxID=2528001 RepID=A0A5C6A978_9BACT|nr:PEP-CTERM sorting domain-containing protein [Botrimarina colliarenosi]TWT95986.1 hypothetical protein Pla108_30650 [Botrimarina colliarenosi]
MPNALPCGVLTLTVAWSFACQAVAAPLTAASNRATAPGDASAAAVVERLGTAAAPIDRQIAQTFLTVNGGVLQSISVTAGARGGLANQDGQGLRVTLTEFTAGMIGDVLATAPVDNVELLAGFGGPFTQPDVLQATATFDAASVVLTSGVTYAMVFSAERFTDSFFILGGNLGYPDGALGGRTGDSPFGFGPLTDLFFDVTVEAIPEPTSIALLASGGLATGRRRSMRRRGPVERGPVEC